MTPTSSSAYEQAFAALHRTGGGLPWLPALRRAAMDRFSALDFPTTRDEDWHFTSVTPIAERVFKVAPARSGAATLSPADVAELVIGDPEWHRLVFVNGRFEASLSAFAARPAEVRVMTLAEALKEAPEFVAEHLGKLASGEGGRQAFRRHLDGRARRLVEVVVVEGDRGAERVERAWRRQRFTGREHSARAAEDAPLEPAHRRENPSRRATQMTPPMAL